MRMISDEDWWNLMHEAIDAIGEGHEAIQRKAAYKWAAYAAYAQEDGRPLQARDYAHEAIEHAALSGDDYVLDDVRELLANYEIET